jgi:hypothetical protein
MRGAVSPCCEVRADDEIERHKLLERQKQHLLFPVPLEVWEISISRAESSAFAWEQKSPDHIRRLLLCDKERQKQALTHWGCTC